MNGTSRYSEWPMGIQSLLAAGLMAAVLSWPAPGLASTNGPAMGRRGPERGAELSAGARIDPESRYNDGSELTAWRIQAGAGVRRPLGPCLVMGDVSVESAAYSFRREGDALFGRSGFMQDALSLRFGVLATGPINNRWGWQAGGSLALSGEADADPAEALNIGALGGVNCQVNDAFRWSLSVVGFGFEGSPLVVPIPGFDWRINRRWRLATQGPGLVCSFTPALAATLSCWSRWEYRQYRLDDDPPVPGGKYYDQRVPIGLELAWPIGRRLELAVEGGCYVYQQMMLRDRHDDKVVTVVGDPSAFIGARLGWRL